MRTSRYSLIVVAALAWTTGASATDCSNLSMNELTPKLIEAGMQRYSEGFTSFEIRNPGIMRRMKRKDPVEIVGDAALFADGNVPYELNILAAFGLIDIPSTATRWNYVNLVELSNISKPLLASSEIVFRIIELQLDSPSAFERSLAVACLVGNHSEKAGALIERALKDESETVRTWAEKAKQSRQS